MDVLAVGDVSFMVPKDQFLYILTLSVIRTKYSVQKLLLMKISSSVVFL
jgi:hypothetical protein